MGRIKFIDGYVNNFAKRNVRRQRRYVKTAHYQVVVVVRVDLTCERKCVFYGVVSANWLKNVKGI